MASVSYESWGEKLGAINPLVALVGRACGCLESKEGKYEDIPCGFKATLIAVWCTTGFWISACVSLGSDDLGFGAFVVISFIFVIIKKITLLIMYWPALWYFTNKVDKGSWWKCFGLFILFLQWIYIVVFGLFGCALYGFKFEIVIPYITGCFIIEICVDVIIATTWHVCCSVPATTAQNAV